MIHHAHATPERCPDCGGPPVASTPDLVAERCCADGHVWHRCGVCGRAVRGFADRFKTAFDQRCRYCPPPSTPAAAALPLPKAA